MKIKAILAYLKKEKLTLTTAESCTAGQIIHLLAKCSGSGECLDAGFVVYSTRAKKRLLDVKQVTIDKHTLSSEEVAIEMVKGALQHSYANVAISTTGVAGSESMDGIAPGTVCFAWGFKIAKQIVHFSETKHFDGNRNFVITQAAQYALGEIQKHYQTIKDLN